MQNDKALADQISAMIPKNLDDVIRAHRDKAALRLSSVGEMDALKAPVNAGWPVKGEFRNWRFITFAIQGSDPQPITQVTLLGDSGRGSLMTSLVTAIDLETSLVTTHSGSVYRLVGNMGQGEPPTDQLICVCAVFHAWGRGAMLGVPYFFY